MTVTRSPTIRVSTEIGVNHWSKSFGLDSLTVRQYRSEFSLPGVIEQTHSVSTKKRCNKLLPKYSTYVFISLEYLLYNRTYSCPYINDSGKRFPPSYWTTSPTTLVSILCIQERYDRSWFTPWPEETRFLSTFYGTPSKRPIVSSGLLDSFLTLQTTEISVLLIQFHNWHFRSPSLLRLSIVHFTTTLLLIVVSTPHPWSSTNRQNKSTTSTRTTN